VTQATPEAGVDAGLVRRLRPLLRLLGPRHRSLVGAAVAVGIVHHLLVLASAATGAWLVGRALAGADAADLGAGLAVLAALVVPTALTPLLESYLNHVAAFEVLADLRTRVYEAFERLAPAYLLERRSGDLGATVSDDVEQLELFYAHTLTPLAVAVAAPVAALAGLSWFHWSLPLVLAPPLVLLATVPSWLRRRAQAQGTELRGHLAELSAEAAGAVAGLRELVTFGAGDRQRARIADLDDRLLATKVAHARRSGLEHAIVDVLTVAGLIAVLVTAALLVTGGALDPALAPVAVVMALTTFTPVIAVTDVARDLNVVSASADRIAEVLAATPSVTDLVAEPPPGPIEPRVRFDQVSFRYGPGLPDAVTGVSLTIEPGETVALVGASGAGKSTCANLLLRLWDVDAGAITIGGHDLRAFPQEALRELITLVPQDVYLFATSIRDNIRLGRPGATDEEVEAAAAAALADEFIAGLPDGYDTVPGEMGAQLSGGQRQRIAIARALLKDAPVLVLDEAVSNLDTVSESEVGEAMARARSGRTTLVIAHRLSTIRAADRIVVLAGGRVAETGTHDELVARDGAYTALVRSQLGIAA